MAAARPCSGAPTAMPAFLAPTRSNFISRLRSIRNITTRRLTSKISKRTSRLCCGGPVGSLPCAKITKHFRAEHWSSCFRKTQRCSPFCAVTSAKRSWWLWICHVSPSPSKLTSRSSPAAFRWRFSAVIVFRRSEEHFIRLLWGRTGIIGSSCNPPARPGSENEVGFRKLHPRQNFPLSSAGPRVANSSPSRAPVP